MPPTHNLSPSVTSTPCFRTNSTRWRPYPSVSESQSIQESASKEDEIQMNLARLFRPYNCNPVFGSYKGKQLKKKREVPWSHFFFCLSEPESVFLPSFEDSKLLEECGLGRKLITFSNNTASHAEVAECLYQAYPLLRHAGGFTLARSDRKRELTKIPIPPTGYSVAYLRLGCKAKRTPIYIIPLQKHIVLQPPEENNRMVDEHQQNDMSPSQPTTEICHGEESEPDLETILRRLENQLDAGPPPFSNYINVMRDTVLSSAMRAFSRQNFSPEKRLNVVFVDTENTGEGAVDDGGPTREFFRLMIAELKNSRYFCGPEEVKNLALVSRAVQAGDYRVIGQMLAVSVIHAGITPSFFSERLYSLISHCPTPPADIEEIEDWEVRQMLQKIKNAETLEGAQDAMIEASGILALLGCSTNLRSLHDRDSLVEEAARAYVEGRVKEATEQLTEGLKTLGLADAIKAHPQMLKPLFISGSKPLDVDDILKLFRVNFSCPGSNRRRVENQTVMFWRDWLIEVGGMYCYPCVMFKNNIF
ncbi:G2/M phase-specific E3 ubiquitin-protein ligase [Labeo rohita]|uniref:G2/M phase-specific E3 ubiquitin-protein ligase n=1 Tax=Labeo rohita TaxID=84645 RepID=A0ABQ8LRB8_LABRO|nr:G2/M phase-specific E3 ubiquitin-protein ligase [Labeo rohita]